MPAADLNEYLSRFDAGRVLIVDAQSDPARQHPDRFDAVVVASAPHDVDHGQLRAVLHYAVQHLAPGGCLVAPSVGCCKSELVAMLGEFDLEPLEPSPCAAMSVSRRTDRTTIHDLVFEARSTIERVTPQQLYDRLGGLHRPLVLDTRTPIDCRREGVIAGSVHTPRTVVEWHIDPANGYRHPAVHSFDQPLVVVCNGGYSSSLAAANLGRIGFTAVADLIGGVRAWLAAGLPVVAPDHSYLDI